MVVVGGIYLLDKLITMFDENKSNGVKEKINTTCEVILNQQPNNVILYDRCRERGYDEFSL